MMARQRPELDDRFRRSKLHRYLLADESVVVAQRQHWAAIAVPVGSAVAGLILVLTLNFFLPPSLFTDLLWWAWLVLCVWAVSKWVMWLRNWLVATNKRVMVNYGLLHQGVAMFSLSRVPDLTYTRSTLGQLLGYGELKREGTGSALTLHKVRFVEHPHATYTTICAAIFDLQDRMFGMDEEDEHDHRLEGAPLEHAPGLVAPYVPPQDHPDVASIPGHQDQEPAEEPEEVDVRVRYGASHQRARESSYQSADLHDPDIASIPYRRPTTDEGAGWQPTTNEPDQRN